MTDIAEQIRRHLLGSQHDTEEPDVDDQTHVALNSPELTASLSAALNQGRGTIDGGFDDAA